MKKKVEEFGILFVVFLIYICSIGNDPILGDSLSFTVQAYKGFDFGTNSTNHFLYSNFLAVLHIIFPKINAHFMFVFFSILCAIFNLYIFRRLLKLFDVSEKNISISVLLLALSFTFWRNSIITEVYSFYLLFALLFFYSYFRNLQKRDFRSFLLSAILFGILLIIHIQTILLIPLYLYFLYYNFGIEKKRIFYGITFPLLFFCILLVPVFQDKQNFLSIFFDNSYNKQFLQFNFLHFVKTFARNVIFFGYNFLYFIPFIFLGFRKIKYKVPIMLILFAYFVFLLKHEVSDSYVFHLIPYIFLIICVGLGLENLSVSKNYFLVLLFPFVYFMTYKIVDKTSFGKKINQETGFKGGNRYFFFPSLSKNPDISNFVNAFENNKIKDKEILNSQFELAKEWIEIKKLENY